ncbi:MAG: hypothetical protein Q7O66_04720 [Dehalococcoidia bacterium]|nr:hypothetical protein [Dehalococcoidia bacterium]
MIGKTFWRNLHFATYGLIVLALGHSFMAGTDTRQTWAILLYAVTAMVVCELTLFRLLDAVDA